MRSCWSGSLIRNDGGQEALAGGPMMGIPIADLNVPIQKQNNGLTVLAKDPVEEAEALMTNCLHCGRCTTVCPVGLMPQMMADAAAAGDLNRYEKKLYGWNASSAAAAPSPARPSGR